ncbi:MAG TPA: LysM peptidoglycan-binding domain-containing protein [Acidimicrobiales bacterium]|nr:LysM peptidoglycan-binding domain-containing protein [Acidimicrobiales bacterium]
MAVALSPIPSRRRSRRPESLRLVTPVRPAPGGAEPSRLLPQSEPDRRCHQARPTRAGCDTEGRTTHPSAAVRRRRVLLGTVAAGLLVALALPWGGTRGPLATPGPALAGEVIAHHARYDVRPGDTLWSIAVRLDPSGDPRPVVAQLAAQIGSGTVVPGEQLTLP